MFDLRLIFHKFLDVSYKFNILYKKGKRGISHKRFNVR